MWFFGFSTSNPRNLWTIGAIILVILFTVILMKWSIYLGSDQQGESNIITAQTNQGEDDCSMNNNNNNKNGCCRFSSSVVGTVIRTYALEELKVATRDFRFRIGVGATSYVYLAELGEGRIGAVKRVMEDRGGTKKIFLDEVSVLRRISHPNLVGLLGFCLERGEQLLLLEYVPNKSLFDRLHTRYGQSRVPLSWHNRLSIALDIARALDYLHSVADPPVIHRDIKSSNILLIDDSHAKLADFGFCKLGNDAQTARTPTTIKGSLGYVDTYYVNTGILSPKCDVYSFGVLLLELITGLKSLQGSTTLPEWTEERRRSKDSEVLVEMLDPKLNGSDVNLEQLRVVVDVANSALVENPEVRPDMSMILYRISSCMDFQVQPELPV